MTWKENKTHCCVSTATVVTRTRTMLHVSVILATEMKMQHVINSPRWEGGNLKVMKKYNCGNCTTKTGCALSYSCNHSPNTARFPHLYICTVTTLYIKVCITNYRPTSLSPVTSLKILQKVITVSYTFTYKF